MGSKSCKPGYGPARPTLKKNTNFLTKSNLKYKVNLKKNQKLLIPLAAADPSSSIWLTLADIYVLTSERCELLKK